MESGRIGKRTLLKTILLGDSGVGKTSLLERYINNKFSLMYKATIGADFMTKEIEVRHNRLITLQLWDTAGQERFQSLGTSFYRGADCCILVYDVTIRETFENLNFWRKEFILHSGISSIEAENYPFVVLGNKIDKGVERAVTFKECERWCQKNGNIPYLEVSAKDSTNVEQAFTTGAELALERRPQMPVPVSTEEGIDLTKSQFNEKTCAC